MKKETLDNLYEFYSPEDKQDFYIAYMYLKHMDLFAYNVLKGLNLPVIEREGRDQSLDELLGSYFRQIGELAPNPETNIYHGKVIKLDDARKLVTLNKPVEIKIPERIVPFKIARDVILDNPEAISVGICACRVNNPEPCIPREEQEVCIIMGDPFASFIAEHNPDFRRCSQDEAVEILEKAHHRGDVHTAYFKKEMGGRLMAICNCCSCCCMGMIMWNKLGGAIPFLASSGYISVIGDHCTGCGSCLNGACPFHAISINADDTRVEVDRTKCMGCGVCENVCPEGAISLSMDPGRGDPLDIDKIRSTMDLSD